MDWTNQFEIGSFAEPRDAPTYLNSLRIVSWNINRGHRLNEVVDFLASSKADLILLQETDANARRTHRRNIARDIAQALRMSYVFGSEFEELTQGRPKSPAWHGQATLSRFPISHSRILRFQSQSNFWRPRWFIPPVSLFQRRLGGRMALVSNIEFCRWRLVSYNLHLESRGSNELRSEQLLEICRDIGRHAANLPIIVAGDFNFDLRRDPAAAIASRALLDNPFGRISRGSTTARSAFSGPLTIDGILTRGLIGISEPYIHDSVNASDHYPLSLTLQPQRSKITD